MPHPKFAALAAATLVLSSFPALADNCDPVVDSMTVTARTPYKSTIIRPHSDGTSIVGHVIQMPDAKYMQQPDGKWTYVTIDSHDLIEALDQNLKTAHMTCHLEGTDWVNDHSASIYLVHTENAGLVSDNKIWIAASKLPLKAEIKIGQDRLVTTYDYDNVQAPVGAVEYKK